jgi:hypothetical protein
MQYAFVLITSEICGACHQFLSKYWELFRDDLISQYKEIKIVHINIAGKEYAPICSESFNPEILSYIKAFPSFVFMKYDDFIYSPIRMQPDYVYGVDEKYGLIYAPRDISSIGNWVKEKLSLLNTETIPTVNRTSKIRRQRR